MKCNTKRGEQLRVILFMRARVYVKVYYFPFEIPCLGSEELGKLIDMTLRRQLRVVDLHYRRDLYCSATR